MVAPDKEGSLLATGFQGRENTQPLSEEGFHTQDGNLQESFRAPQTEPLRSMGPNRHFPAQLRINNTETSTREFLSSMSASPLYCTGVEPIIKDLAPPAIRTNPAILSGFYCSEGLAKDFSTFPPSDSSGVSNMYASDMKFTGFNATSCHAHRQWIPQKPQNYQVKSSEKDHSSHSSVRLPRPPSEGRSKNQLLPRYWPRITDQELQLLTTKDSNCTITPLFEKVLSASDAGKIGRLVLPKACAEAYFPSISQAEGLPITVQDISGKDWQFQFRFWPNNNSRMYVLEGITPCIQSMQLQAGDTVIFSRRDPEGKLVMGYRRASNSPNAEETRTIVGSSPPPPSTQIHSRKMDKPSPIVGTSGVNPLGFKSSGKAQGQIQKGIGPIAQSQRSDLSLAFSKSGNGGFKGPREGSPYNLSMSNEKRKPKDFSSKPKKPKCDPDSLDFKMNWEEAQMLLRSPPNVTPSIVTIEGYDFEEYEDPPVFGNELNSSESPKHKPYLVQDGSKISREGDLQHVPGIVSMNDSAGKKQALTEPIQELDTFFGLETLASLATAEENVHVAPSSSASSPAKITAATSCLVAPAPSSELPVSSSASTIATPAMPSPATTTKHPRHRPGCSCIVCIQPPSGKGPKHKPTCDCNVCVTVKRRFHTLMLRRKKLQSEKEVESSSQKNQHVVKETVENMGAGRRINDSGSYKNGSWQGGMGPAFTKVTTPRAGDSHSNRISGAMNASSTGVHVAEPVKMESDQIGTKGPEIDLNSQPEREEEMGRGLCGQSMKSLLQNASYPLDVYLKKHGIPSLVCSEQLQLLENSGGTSLDKNSGGTSLEKNSCENSLDKKDDEFSER